MSGPFEKYADRATQAFCIARWGETATGLAAADDVEFYREGVAAAVEAVGPLIVEDTRERIVAAAAERDGVESEVHLNSCIWIDPGRQSGVACFGGTRVPVDPFMAMVEEAGVETARALWPSVTDAHVAAGKLWRARYHEWLRGAR